MPYHPYPGPPLQFECAKCGECCRVHGVYAYIYVSLQDMEKIADLLKISIKRFVDTYTDRHETEPPGQNTWLYHLKMVSNDHCVFLIDGLCRIHDVKPIQCVVAPFIYSYLDRGGWRPEAREFCKGIGTGRMRSNKEVCDSLRTYHKARTSLTYFISDDMINQEAP
jgi:Fe-S-cluster containining protein